MTSMNATISVTVGNIIALQLGDPSTSRQTAFDDIALKLNIIGFDPTIHKMTIPQTPFKPKTTVRWEDKGLHITVAQHGRDIVKGTKDVVDEKAMMFDGQKVSVGINETFYLLEGTPENDEATGGVYYVGVEADESAIQVVNDIRDKLGLPRMNAMPHISVAIIGPLDGDMAKFRKNHCFPRPAVGFPKPLTSLPTV